MNLLEKLRNKLRNKLRRGSPAAETAPPKSTDARAHVHAVRRMPTPAWAASAEPYDWYAVEVTVTSTSSKLKALELMLVGNTTVGVSDARLWDDDAWQSAEGQGLWGECRLRILFALPVKATGTWHLCGGGSSLGTVDLSRARLS